MFMFYTVYKMTNLINNKIYIGVHVTKNLDDGYLGSGKYLWKAINKYGAENFKKEYIKFCKDLNEMLAFEKKIVNEDFIKAGNCYNLTLGGKGGWWLENSNPEIQKRKSKNMNEKLKLRRKNDLTFDIKMRKTARENFINAHKSGKIKYDTFTGKKHKQETKDSIGFKNSIHMKGTGNSNYGNCWIFSEIKKMNKIIKKTDIKKYLSEGWKKGRKLIF